MYVHNIQVTIIFFEDLSWKIDFCLDVLSHDFIGK